MTNKELLATVPDGVAVELSFFKSTPKEEGGHRYIYCEASNEANDVQKEVMLAKALANSTEYFLHYGNVDIDHLTKIGLSHGIANPHFYEIGRPVEVRMREPRTYVKSEIFQGSEMADFFWKSQTETRPPQRWYPSVAGGVLQKSIVYDPAIRERKGVISAVRWSNLAFSKEPINHAVPMASLSPVGPFGKCLTFEEFAAKSAFGDLKICSCEGECPGKCAKGITAGYGTELSTLTGGGALREESLEPHLQYYWVAAKILKGAGKPESCDHLKGKLTREGLTEHVNKCEGVEITKADEYVRRLLSDVGRRIGRT
jgi:hypothetical protein